MASYTLSCRTKPVEEVEMEINLRLEVSDEDVDANDGTGLTSEAYENLCGALSDLGYSIVSGPTAVK